MIDLRSDTVTRPTEAMRKVISCSAVGDDMFREDPEVNALEEKVASLFEKESGLFVPSGTMGNQLAVKVLTQPGDEVIIEEKAHLFHAETAACSMISGVQLYPLKGIRGMLDADMVLKAIRGDHDWEPRTGLISVENTANMGGGTCYPLDKIQEIYTLAQTVNIPVHIDGARIWNASIASDIPLPVFGALCDTISVCFSKGLGAPVGSMLLSDSKTIEQARRYRKVLGGGMRQAGLLASAASYAVDHHFPMLKEDHRRAALLAEAVAENDAFFIQPKHVETNIVIFEVVKGSVDSALKWLSDHGVAMVPFGGNTIRATFHLEINDQGLDMARKAVTSYRPVL
ncbi:GntG family PLP-dependent aldolase [Balneolaceae bacterium ANBcel3]|nr:GntG family PLP-dependent aldolase [Balneolaceae bacterium ANBcel3]